MVRFSMRGPLFYVTHMARKKKQLSETDIINKWMVECHGITIEEAYAKEPWTNSRDFYLRYSVTDEQHDSWREWLIQTLMKHTGMSRKYIERQMWAIYLNTAPTVRPVSDNMGEGDVI